MAGNLLTRDDTLLGICEGWGEDLGVNANWLRVALATLVLWDPLVMVALYAAMGVTLVLTRLVFPERGAGVATAAEVSGPMAADEAEEPLPLAA